MSQNVYKNELNCKLIVLSLFVFYFCEDGWMRRSGCLGVAPLLAPSDPRNYTINKRIMRMWEKT